MFGKRENRASRRQRALEELLWLDPVERERRAIAAVASGDFTADEVEASLRLVSRLDALRAMDLPGSGRLIGAPEVVRGATAVSSDDVELGMVAGLNTDANPIVEDHHDDELIGIPIYSEEVGIPVGPDLVGIPVLPDHEAGADAGSDSTVPLDALESAERWISRQQHFTRAASPAIARRAAEAGLEWNVGVDTAGVRPVDESGPTISWLRPN